MILYYLSTFKILKMMIGLGGKKRLIKSTTVCFSSRGRRALSFTDLSLVLKFYFNRSLRPVLEKGPLTQTCWHLLPLTPTSRPACSAPDGFLLLLPSSLQDPFIKGQLPAHLSLPHALPPLIMNLQELDRCFLQQLPPQKATLKGLSRR